MMRLLPIAVAALGTVGCSPGHVSGSCPRGRCDDGGAPPRLDAGDGGGAGDAAIPPDGAPEVDSGPPEVDSGPPEVDAWMEIDSGPPPPCEWVWVDRGGPGFQPHACRPGAGVVDGMLVDPMAFFSELVAGRDADSWQSVMNEIEGELWSCGVGQQRGSGGDVRGRLFLPTAACPDASPPAGDTMAMFLGVRQEPDCWSHPADVVSCP